MAENRVPKASTQLHVMPNGLSKPMTTMSSSIYNASSPPPLAHNVEDAEEGLDDADSLSGHGEDPDYSGNEEEEEEEPERPNRWIGSSSTWLGITEQERGMAASLEQLRSRDLAVHLYNAFALKRRGRELEEGNRRGELSDNLVDTDRDEPFLPPKSWTAWPLPVGEVPREGEENKERDADGYHGYTFRKEEGGRDKASRLLEDVLTATSLRFSKERLERREWGDEDIEEGNQAGNGDADEESEDGGYREDNNDVRVKDGSQAPATTYLKPVISADDEKSAELLHPSVRYSMEKLDAVLIALHHARATCRRYAEADTGGETSNYGTPNYNKSPSKSPVKAGIGRPRKFDLPHRERQEDPNTGPKCPGDFIRRKNSTKGTCRGRQPIQYPALEGETEQDYFIRIARMQKKPLPAFAPRESPTKLPSKSPSKGPVTPRKNRADSMVAAENHLKRLGLRDWSEVLGMASLAGFPEDVVKRATKRCADIFGEGMVVRTLIEAPFFEEITTFDTTYQPDMISDLDSDSVDSQDAGVKPFRDVFSQSYLCPVKNCTEEKGFKDQLRLTAHLRGVHEFSKEEAAEFDVASDEEVKGAVHVDGYLRPVKRGWRGMDKKPRKKRAGTVLGSEILGGVRGSENGGMEDEG